ncbi:MAG: tol-pal system protein YbgF [Oleiphilus sp.]
MLLSSFIADARTLIFQSGQSTENSAAAVTQNQSPPSTTLNTPAVASVNNSGLSANSELFFMIEQLQQELNSLRGMVEEQAYELRMLKQSGKDRYLDLDTRILDITRRMSSASNVPSSHPTTNSKEVQKPRGPIIKAPELADDSTAEPVTKPLREPTKAEDEAYKKAYALIKDKKFDESIIALFSYTENYPESPLLPNVYYWLGEVYLATSKLEQAKTSFSLVVTAYPSSQKISDALYKLAVTLDRLGDAAEAKKYLAEVQSKFPDSTASKLAAGYQIQ